MYVFLSKLYQRLRSLRIDLVEVVTVTSDRDFTIITDIEHARRYSNTIEIYGFIEMFYGFCGNGVIYQDIYFIFSDDSLVTCSG